MTIQQALPLPRRRRQPAQASSVAGALVLFGVLALLLGLLGAVGGWIAQLLALTLLVPAVLLAADYRIGLVLLVLLMPFANSRLMPQAGPLNPVNMLLAGVCLLYLLRVALTRMSSRRAPAPLPVGRELLLYYLLPVTLAVVVGTTHLSEIPQFYLVFNKMEAFGLSQYWVSLYLKSMLLVLCACIFGAAVMEYGKGLRFAVAMSVAAVLFVVAMLVLIAVTGISLDKLKDARSFLVQLGRHNNEAGVLLCTALGPMLFMHACVKHRVGRWSLAAAIALVIGGIVLTFSRGAFLGMLGILGMYVLRLRRLTTVLVVLTLVAVAAALAPAALYERLGAGLDEGPGSAAITSERDELTAGRVYTWKQLAPEVLRSPLWGRGMLSTQWSTHVKTSLYNANHPHNMYLEILMDMGLLGALAMFFFYRHVWRTFRWLGEDERLEPVMRGFFVGARAALLAMFIYGVSNGHYYPAPEQIFYWVAVGLAFGYARKLGGPLVEPHRRRFGGRRRVRVPPERILGPLPASRKA